MIGEHIIPYLGFDCPWCASDIGVWRWMGTREAAQAEEKKKKTKGVQEDGRMKIVMWEKWG